MGRTIIVTASDYRAIMQWDDDGGAPVSVEYEIVPSIPSKERTGVSRKPDMRSVPSRLPVEREKGEKTA